MPIYRFECDKCNEVYEEITSYDESGKYKGVKCPKCKSKKKHRRFDYEVAVTFADPRDTSKFDNFSYRAGWNMNKAKGERRAAESKSHMGTNPYSSKKLD